MWVLNGLAAAPPCNTCNIGVSTSIKSLLSKKFLIKDNFFIDSANKIVYLRGRIIANELNVELQKHTKYDLDFYIKTLIKNIDNNNEIEVNMESLIQTIRNITGYDAKKFLSIKTNAHF